MALFAVDTGGTGDYSSLNAALSLEGYDMVSGTDSCSITTEASTGVADTSIAIVQASDGWVSNSTYFLTIIGQDTLDNEWNTSAWRMEVSSAQTAWRVDVDYTVCKNLQIQNSSGTSRRVHSSIGDECELINCIHRADNAYSSTCLFSFTGSATTCYMKNCLGYGYGTNFAAIGILVDNGSAYIHNCTFEGVSNDGLSASSDGTIIAKNVISYNNTDDWLPTGTINADYCSYSDGTDPGTNSINLGAEAGTDLWSDYSNNVYKTKDSSAAIYGAGTDLSSDANYPVTDDMAGNTRSQWDIGSSEYVTGGGGTTEILDLYSVNGSYLALSQSLAQAQNIQAANGDYLPLSQLLTQIQNLQVANGDYLTFAQAVDYLLNLQNVNFTFLNFISNVAILLLQNVSFSVLDFVQTVDLDLDLQQAQAQQLNLVAQNIVDLNVQGVNFTDYDFSFVIDFLIALQSVQGTFYPFGEEVVSFLNAIIICLEKKSDIINEQNKKIDIINDLTLGGLPECH